MSEEERKQLVKKALDKLDNNCMEYLDFLIDCARIRIENWSIPMLKDWLST